MFCHIVMLSMQHYVLFHHSTRLSSWPEVLAHLRASFYCRMHSPVALLHCFPCSEEDFAFYLHCWRRCMGIDHVRALDECVDLSAERMAEIEASWAHYDRRFVREFPESQLCWHCRQVAHAVGEPCRVYEKRVC